MTVQPCVFLVDDDYAVRDSLSLVFEAAGFDCQAYENAEDFLEHFCPDKLGCLVLDVNMPGLDGHELQSELVRRQIHLPIIFLTAHGDIPMTVRAIKAGAIDFLTKPVSIEHLIARVQAALQHVIVLHEQAIEKQALCSRLNDLTSRELEIMHLLVAGLANKEIGKQLGISHRTVEIHRSRVFEKTGATNLLELDRFCKLCGLPSDH